MDYLPLFHNIQGRKCLIVGGGETALRKVRPLLEAGARVQVVAPEIRQGLRELADRGKIQVSHKRFHPNDLAGAVLVIAATDEGAVNEQVSRWARERNIPVNVVDNPALCSVIFPSIVDRSPVQIAISTGGSGPVLARMLRGRLESLLPANLGRLARLAERFRPRVKEKIPAENGRRAFWEGIFEGPVAELVYSGRDGEAEAALAKALEAPDPQPLGEVYLVGGGPGDPDLLTFRALRLMQQADIVLYDRLVSKAVLDLVRRDAERIYVGKTAGDHPVTQDNINRKLVEYAREGKRVLRLKGGDPFIFGRGGEEIEHLAEHGIPFQVVPGITAASGCASYAGIPLTHRDHAQSVRFIAGHRRDDELNLPWRELAAPGQTLVFYMGLNGLETICRELAAAGMGATMPAALIEKGTSPRQRVFVGTLADLPEKVREGQAKAPTLIIVGTVVSLHHRLRWFGGADEGKQSDD
ncbi:MAG: siroheme synthase CysG [Porticoccaceae bacterium]|jgi:uroporphyrin-III C-methyltransferase/precorrin-2 dehydrogenase/sirohydrochlorin ferrochelatase|nr:siroheme synthase CysG [Porticoccaceae bacterium]MEA3301016.1 siroheme synthase CysG [Pseudomonadota bacterium]HLS98603.1 siroheme synthase CysG [Porticoccaceae bacterium]